MKNKEHSQSLKALRERFGASLQECADILDVEKTTYWMKENGQRGVGADELALLADHFGVSLADAFPEYEPSAGALALARLLPQKAA